MTDRVIDVLSSMTEIETKVTLGEVKDLQTDLKSMDDATRGSVASGKEAAHATVSSNSLGPIHYQAGIRPIVGRPEPQQVWPKAKMNVTKNVGVTRLKLLEAQKVMPNTVAVSANEHKATHQRSAKPFPGFRAVDEPLTKTLEHLFKEVCSGAQHAASRRPRTRVVYCGCRFSGIHCSFGCKRSPSRTPCPLPHEFR